jgi:hypothetical protein
MPTHTTRRLQPRGYRAAQTRHIDAHDIEDPVANLVRPARRQHLLLLERPVRADLLEPGRNELSREEIRREGVPFLVHARHLAAVRLNPAVDEGIATVAAQGLAYLCELRVLEQLHLISYSK